VEQLASQISAAVTLRSLYPSTHPRLLYSVDQVLIALRRVVSSGAARVLMKLESANPTGSMKDRMAKAAIEGAEANGRLPRGGTVVELTLANEGQEAIIYALTPNDYQGRTQTVTVQASGATTVSWPADRDGYYDVVITAGTSDGFRRRYAGRIA